MLKEAGRYNSTISLASVPDNNTVGVDDQMGGES